MELENSQNSEVHKKQKAKNQIGLSKLKAAKLKKKKEGNYKKQNFAVGNKRSLTFIDLDLADG